MTGLHRLHRTALATVTVAGLALAVSIASARTAPAPAAPAAPAAPTAVAAGGLPGLGALSGKVSSPKAMGIAKVTAFNAEKSVKYVVFAVDGTYRAVNMFPGTYKVTIEKPGFAVTEQTATVAADRMTKLDFAARTAPVADDYIGGMTYPGAKIVPYDVAYPAGRGREIMERTCQGCHTVQLFPANVKRTYPTGRNLKDKDAWAITVDRMHKGPAFGQKGVSYFNPKLLQPGDREILIDYLAANFGAESEVRVVKKDFPDAPLDPQALAKAQIIEFVFPNVPGEPERFTQQIDFCKGDVYVTDRGLPGLVRLDPRTGQRWDYAGHGGGHGISIDEDCAIWYSGDVVRRYDPAVGTRDSYVIEGGRGLGSNTTMWDSNGDLWMSLLGAGKLGKWDRKTDTVQYWDLDQGDLNYGLSRPYGLVVDHKDRVWFGEYHKSSVGMFDPKTQTYKSYKITDLAPTNMRRLGADSQNNIWISTWGRPNIKEGGAIYKLEPDTGKVTEFPLGIPYSNPYDTQADNDDMIWAATDNYLVRLDPKTGKMTNFPLPARTDVPKMTIARNGAIWFEQRNAGQAGSYGGSAGALYVDKDKMTELAAYFADNSPANRLSLYLKKPGAVKLPKVQGVIKQSPGGAQNSANPGRATAPTILGPVKKDEGSAYLE